MAEPIDVDELRLVIRAITLGLTTGGCCEWQDRAVRRLRARPPFEGFTPEGIKQLLCELVAERPAAVTQVIEKREEYQDHRYYYKVVIPVAGSQRGLFVELVLIDDEAEYPVVPS
jgi:hypothetical protein